MLSALNPPDRENAFNRAWRRLVSIENVVCKTESLSDERLWSELRSARGFGLWRRACGLGQGGIRWPRGSRDEEVVIVKVAVHDSGNLSRLGAECRTPTL